jgi:hypothetical protein
MDKDNKFAMDKKSIGKIVKGMLFPALIVMMILSVQTNENSVKALISVYIFMVGLVGYIIIDFFTTGKISKQTNLNDVDIVSTEGINTDALSGFGKFMKSLTVVIIVLTMLGMIFNLSFNYFRIVGGEMPNSYYNFTMLVNLFLAIQISIVVFNLLANNGNLYTLSDKMTMISIFFGQLGIIMFSILVSITIYNYTQG